MTSRPLSVVRTIVAATAMAIASCAVSAEQPSARFALLIGVDSYPKLPAGDRLQGARYDVGKVVLFVFWPLIQLVAALRS